MYFLIVIIIMGSKQCRPDQTLRDLGLHCLPLSLLWYLHCPVFVFSYCKSEPTPAFDTTCLPICIILVNNLSMMMMMMIWVLR